MEHTITVLIAQGLVCQPQTVITVHHYAHRGVHNAILVLCYNQVTGHALLVREDVEFAIVHRCVRNAFLGTFCTTVHVSLPVLLGMMQLLKHVKAPSTKYLSQPPR